MCRAFIGECPGISTRGRVKEAERAEKVLGYNEVASKASVDPTLAAVISHQSNFELAQGNQAFICLH